MLLRLTIEEIALIRHQEIGFHAGLNLLTGETGAGKSILLDALGLVLGARAETSLLASGAEKARVTGEFRPAPDHPARAWLKERELDSTDDLLLIRRVLSANGPNRAFINETPVSQGALAELGALLVEIHGQQEQQTLLNPASHLAILDAFGGLRDQAAAVARAFEAWQTVSAEGERLKQRAAQARERREFLEFQVEELNRAGVVVGELAELEGKRQRLAHGGKLLTSLEEALARLTEGNPSASGLLSRALPHVEEMARLDESLEPLVATLQSLSYDLEEAGARLGHYRDALELDPAELENLEERIHRIRHLMRKHQCEADQLPVLRHTWQEELDGLEHLDADLEGVARRREAALGQWREVAERLKSARREAASRLIREVEKELAELHMASTRLAATHPAGDGEPRAYGLEGFALMVSTNPGEPPRPLKQVASGGELARLMLALKQILASAMSVSTMVFDEADVGVGGRTAAAIGLKMARLAAGGRQVLAVTHAPQVAAWADRHLKVEKGLQGERTVARVQVLNDEERVEELARMLAADRITPQARENARELLRQARLPTAGNKS
ncbi:MAG: DNA repair protein RecN [Magnetococcales bacterium]|nr:DNA repair protein RecN [Magnetococcales bacterium]